MVPDQEYLSSLPRVLYHSCDRAAMEGIIGTSGLIPGGFPKKTGRAHNYFTTCPPWKAQMRKLAGTRAGQPIYLAFDTELVMQHGCRVFATRKSILSLDWVPNAALMYTRTMPETTSSSGSIRAYAKMRQNYHEEMKSHSTDDPQFRLSKLAEARNYMLNNARQNQQHVKVGQINLMRGAVKMTGITDEVATHSEPSVPGGSAARTYRLYAGTGLHHHPMKRCLVGQERANPRASPRARRARAKESFATSQTMI